MDTLSSVANFKHCIAAKLSIYMQNEVIMVDCLSLNLNQILHLSVSCDYAADKPPTPQKENRMSSSWKGSGSL